MYLSPEGMIHINTYGASKWDPYKSGWGLIVRDHEGIVLGTMIGGLGHTTNVAEYVVILEAMKKAIEKGWTKLWIITDSAAASKAYLIATQLTGGCKENLRRREKFEWLPIKSSNSY
ncbi:hypothetical protein FRX31_008683 [Thalictrum thalictroides]|uniref:RNase H type-1 domain-containing protein n=1 Tax=Thalictrum thalictroides TaxID=46969 RepID=A0A7J6WYS1_THATH|nr:hypothetical protein FRX31_008683 [Thalictrum thalictroides]